MRVKANEYIRFQDENIEQLTLLKKGNIWANILKAPLGEVPLIRHMTSAKKTDVDASLKILFIQEWSKDKNLS